MTSNCLSVEFMPTSPTLCSHLSPKSHHASMVEDDEDFDLEKSTMQCSGSIAGEKHHYNGHRQRHARAFRLQESEAFAEEFPAYQEEEILFFRLVRDIYDTIPNNPLLFGTFLCVTSSTLTPLSPFLLSGLFFEVSNGGRNSSVINTYGDIVLMIAATEGLLISVKIAVIEGPATWLRARTRP